MRCSATKVIRRIQNSDSNKVKSTVALKHFLIQNASPGEISFSNTLPEVKGHPIIIQMKKILSPR